MISDQNAVELAKGLIDEYNRETYSFKEEDSEHFLKFNELVYDEPADSIVVLRALCREEITPRVIEGVGAGPVRTLLMLYGDNYDKELSELGLRKPEFRAILEIAYDGLD